ncbi:thioesterase family protein [Streptomyces javensis]|uniref:thioesterase family protein n=1 Tax=Streptomyces javensis TaxID=114698 RepID=UPI0033E2B3E9
MSSTLPDYRQTVRPEWIDYNGHMSEAFYVLVFGHSTDEMMVETGLDSAYRAKTGCSLYTVESHIRYLNEVAEGAELTIRTRVIGVDEKKVRFTHEMHVGEPDGAPVATTELLALHIDQKESRSAPFPDEVRERLTDLLEKAPEWAGRAIGPVPAEAG